MLRIPLTITPDPELPEAASPFVEITVDGDPTLALLDTGAATSAVVELPGCVTRLEMLQTSTLFPAAF